MAKEVVRVGDLHQCPIHGDNVVISGQAAISDPKPIACIGDRCACGVLLRKEHRLLPLTVSKLHIRAAQLHAAVL